MTTLSRDFETKAQEVLIDEVVASFTAKNGPIWEAVEHSHEVLRDYGREHDYDVGPVIEALSEPAITVEGNTVTAFWGWQHPAAPHFATGTSEHTINGNPVLTFVWDDPPQWVREEFDEAQSATTDGWRVFFSNVTVSGLPESRFVRAGLDHVRNQLS